MAIVGRVVVQYMWLRTILGWRHDMKQGSLPLLAATLYKVPGTHFIPLNYKED